MKRITNMLRLSLLVLLSLMAVDAWINQLNLTLCRRDIRCYRKALICERRLRFLELEVFMLRALNECQAPPQPGIGTFKSATITDLETVLATAGDDRVRDVARCLFSQLGLWKNGAVDQVAFYYMLSYANISSDAASQEAFLDALSSCPPPELEQMPNFLGCVVQACVQST